MDTIIISNILKAVIMVANFYMLLMTVLAVLSLLALFGVIDLFANNFCSKVYFGVRNFLNPVLGFIARFIPNINGIDLPFLVLLLFLWIIIDLAQSMLNNLGSISSFGM